MHLLIYNTASKDCKNKDCSSLLETKVTLSQETDLLPAIVIWLALILNKEYIKFSEFFSQIPFPPKQIWNFLKKQLIPGETRKMQGELGTF